jgi:signal transduction histidine kinase
MSFRVKLLALFAALAIVPLLAVGVFDYIRSIRALESLVVAQTSVIADRIAVDLADRLRALEADVGLFAENAETRAMYRTRPQDAVAWSARRDDLRRFLQAAWGTVGRNVRWISYRDPNGDELFRLGEAGGDGPTLAEYAVTRDIRDGSGKLIGRVEVAARLDSLLPQEALRTRFGRQGLSVVIDNTRGEVLHVAGNQTDRRIPEPLLETWKSRPTEGTRTFAYREGDSIFIGSSVRLPEEPFTILTVASRDEFSAPFSSIRSSNLAAVLTLTVIVATAFILLLWRGTRSLSELTLAADQVARGNLSPVLPRPGTDEIGRLSGTFAYMLERIRIVLGEMERSRQMAVVGEFASQISHEIRNPLTSIKLNLQKLERAVATGGVAPELHRPVAISLTQIQRLDRVVRGALRLGRPGGKRRARFRLGDAIVRAIDATRPQLEPAGVRIHVGLSATRDTVLGDPEQIEGMIVNLMLNAAEAMPAGGSIHVGTENPASQETITLRIEDNGPGVPIEHRELIFKPFYTTKPEGTGLGLSLAQRTVEEHRGTITIVDAVRGSGAAFLIELPIARELTT